MKGRAIQGGAHRSMVGHLRRQEFDGLSVLETVAVLGEHLAAAGIARVGVLGTRSIMASPLYCMPSADVIAQERDVMEQVDAAYKALALAGAATRRDRLDAVWVGLMERGATVALLGGTDLSLAFDGVKAGIPWSTARWCMPRRLRWR